MNKLKDWYSRTRTFLVEVRGEWGKVTKPGRREVWTTTAVVVVTSLVFGVFLWGSDKLIEFLYTKTFELLGLR